MSCTVRWFTKSFRTPLIYLAGLFILWKSVCCHKKLNDLPLSNVKSELERLNRSAERPIFTWQINKTLIQLLYMDFYQLADIDRLMLYLLSTRKKNCIKDLPADCSKEVFQWLTDMQVCFYLSVWLMSYVSISTSSQYLFEASDFIL